MHFEKKKNKTWYTLRKMALNFQLQFLTSRKRFGRVKTIATLERARKNPSIYVFYFFLRESAYDYERVKYSMFYAKKCAARFCWPGSHGRRSHYAHVYVWSLWRATLPLLVLAGKEWGNVSSTRSTPQRLHYTNTASDRSSVSSGGGHLEWTFRHIGYFIFGFDSFQLTE